jgi:hypothetical protein
VLAGDEGEDDLIGASDDGADEPVLELDEPSDAADDE